MVKNFSVDWLSRSHHDRSPEQDATCVENTATYLKPHMPCLVQPRPPTYYDKVYLQPKHKGVKHEVSEIIEKLNYEELRSTSPLYSTDCSSPNFSENSGYSSGYESEATSSECTSTEDNERESAGTHRRVRTKFTSEQIFKLEKTFKKQKYLDAAERIKTAAKLNLSETQVRTWFQNRRMKLKREVHDLHAEFLAPAFSPMVLPFVPTVQDQDSAGQRLPYSPTTHALFTPMLQHAPAEQMVPQQPIYPMLISSHFYRNKGLLQDTFFCD